MPPTDPLGVETTIPTSHPATPLVPRTVLPRRCSAQLLWLAAANLGVLVLLALRLRDQARPTTATATTLDRVLNSGVLRVGVTGDYPPFAMRCLGGDHAGMVGSDIDEAAALARSLDAPGDPLVEIPLGEARAR